MTAVQPWSEDWEIWPKGELEENISWLTDTTNSDFSEWISVSGAQASSWKGLEEALRIVTGLELLLIKNAGKEMVKNHLTSHQDESYLNDKSKHKISQDLAKVLIAISTVPWKVHVQSWVSLACVAYTPRYISLAKNLATTARHGGKKENMRSELETDGISCRKLLSSSANSRERSTKKAGREAASSASDSDVALSSQRKQIDRDPNGEDLQLNLWSKDDDLDLMNGAGQELRLWRICFHFYDGRTPVEVLPGISVWQKKAAGNTTNWSARLCEVLSIIMCCPALQNPSLLLYAVQKSMHLRNKDAPRTNRALLCLGRNNRVIHQLKPHY